MLKAPTLANATKTSEPPPYLMSPTSRQRCVKSPKERGCIYAIVALEPLNGEQRFASSGHSKGSIDGTVDIWAADQQGTIRHVMALAGHADLGPVSALASLPPMQLASASAKDSQGVINIWDTATGACMQHLTISGAKVIHDLLRLPNGLLASGSFFGGGRDHPLRLWNVTDATCVQQFPCHGTRVHALATLGKQWLLSGDDGGKVQKWDVTTGKCSLTINTDTGYVYSLAAFPDNQRFAVGGLKEVIHIYDATGGRLQILAGHKSSIYALSAITNDYFFSAGDDGTFRLWQLRNEAHPPQYEALWINAASSERINGLLYHSHLKQLITASHNGYVDVWKFPAQTTPPAWSPPHAEPALQLLNNYAIQPEELQLKQLVGRGSFGSVYHGQWHHNDVAIKQFDATHLTTQTKQVFIKEINTMAQLHAPHIVHLYGYSVTTDAYYIVMEYFTRGSLYKVLHQEAEPLAWAIKLKIADHIARGIAFLHAQQLLHGDLKSLNVLITADYSAKLSDFGLLANLKTEILTTSTQTTPASDTATAQPAPGTPAWMPPEAFKRKTRLDAKSDMYSYGMILWELAAQQIPWREAKGQAALIMTWVSNGEREDIPEDCQKNQPRYARLIQWCWQQDPKQRPTASDVLAELVHLDSEPSHASKPSHTAPQPDSDTSNKNTSTGYRNNLFSLQG
ncbi:MAG: hypothetical protein Tsb005_17730 [Gammaproteobacteria bacterium]